MAGFIFRNFHLKARLLFTLLVIIIVFNEGRGNTQAQCIERERQALLRFKENLVDSANLLSSWKINNQNCCAWKGVRCDNRTNHVVMLKLRPKFMCIDKYDCVQNSYIGGEIDFALVELRYLEYLDLSYNMFTRIPKFIGSFKRLKYLNLFENPISGTIPSQIQNLTRLQFLDLHSIDQMTVDSLEWLSYLPSLRSLTLGNTDFTKALDWLQSIKMSKSLSTLNIVNCQFPKVDTRPALSYLNFSNSLRTFCSVTNDMHPRSLHSLLNFSPNLVNLTLSQDISQLRKGYHPLPNLFGSLTSLEYIDLSSNLIEGGIPKSWGNFCRLKTLDLSINKLNETLHNLLESLMAGCTANSLEILRLSDNQIGGVFPDMGNFTSLRELYLDYNQLEGPFPYSLSQFPKLTELSMANNKLNDTIPESIGQLLNLRVLDFSSNSFIGVISEVHLQNLFNLERLALSFNSFELNLSSNWVPPFQLAKVELSSCKLGPQFPRWLQTQPDLSVIDLSNSSISDTIPGWFCNLTSKLWYLNLSFNNITGTIPTFPLSYEYSPVIDLSSNKIHGAIQRSLSNASMLDLSNNSLRSFGVFSCTEIIEELPMLILDLSNNILYGRLPECWWKMKQLSILNLEYNELFGTIPSSIGWLHEGISALRLRHNNLSGGLPSSLKNCTELQYLDVGENNLEGEIPTWIGESLTDMVILNLKGNKFQGSIPSNLCNLRYMQILDLSVNNISGAIPSCIDNFTLMIQRDVYDRAWAVGVSPPHSSFISPILNGALIIWKGIEHQYGKNIKLLRLIDLSSNQLTGKIPPSVMNLVELIQLNLSRNLLSGSLPEKIGQLNNLESLDLSHNQLSGEIPQSLATITFLTYLNLSNNHLSGKIPTSTQLQSFDASSYAGNPELCGQPLTITCPGDESTPHVPSDSSGDESSGEASGEWFDMSWFRMGVEVGFAVGFCGVCGNLWLNTSWRLAYFQSFNNLGDWLYVRIIIKVAVLKRRFSS